MHVAGRYVFYWEKSTLPLDTSKASDLTEPLGALLQLRGRTARSHGDKHSCAVPRKATGGVEEAPVEAVIGEREHT